VGPSGLRGKREINDLAESGPKTGPVKRQGIRMSGPPTRLGYHSAHGASFVAVDRANVFL
jgi:hypothetical protein